MPSDTPSQRTMQKNAAVIAIIAAIVLVGFGLWSLLNSNENYAGKIEPINFGTVPTAASALIYIAHDQHFFEDNGLDINVTDYPTGIASTGALLRGDMDIVWVAEFPMVRRAFSKEEISIIAVVDRFNEQHIFGRKDRGISTAADLRGKKLGIPRNTIAEFYLGRFLELHGMTMQDITLVDVGANESVAAIASGRVDGVVAWEPYTSQIRVQMADRIVALPVQSSQPGYGAIVCRNDWISEHPEIVSRFLKSLAKAEAYLTSNPDAAKAIVRKRLNYDGTFTETIWSENQISLSLDQSLILAMEDESRWMIKNNLTTESLVPNFLDYIHEDYLKAVKPESVNVIR